MNGKERKGNMNTAATGKKGFQTTDIVFIGIFAVIIAICSWISIPAAVPFTLQTFGVFAAVEILGGKCGTMAVLVYLLLGAVGIPVFADGRLAQDAPRGRKLNYTNR